MRLLRRLIAFIIVIALVVVCYRHFKPDIVTFFNEAGLDVPGVTDDTVLFPTSETIVNRDGQVTIVVNIPSTYAQELDQSHLDELMADSDGRLVAYKEEDGSVSVTLSEEYRDEILVQMSSYYDDVVLDNLIGGSIISIAHDEAYTIFTVTCEPGMSESEILTLTSKLFAVGKMYSSFSGNGEQSVTVYIVNAQEGAVTNSYSSDNIAQGLASDAQHWAGDVFDQAITNIVEG
jgi:hypothetical protein